ncbi:regulator of PEP synthase PpsR (kinase-PPPase family) [Thermoanaerobacterium thermosaccharolyticum]|nr:regulator of PEP synthase PpsR (kinase-PPPase family) [Thermoanaerobacterium thermosaccharolyticum]
MAKIKAFEICTSLELNYAKEVMQRLDCTVIDVTNKAVEETASIILNKINKGGL